MRSIQRMAMPVVRATPRLTRPAAPRPGAAPAPAGKRNSFRELFEGASTAPTTPAATTRTALATSAAAARTAPALLAASRPLTQPAALPVSPLDTSWLRPSQPVSLDPLLAELRRAGLDPGLFQFDQMEASQGFPPQPALGFLTRQIAIRGPNGAGLFDRDLALRTPWVTAIELRSYGIA